MLVKRNKNPIRQCILYESVYSLYFHKTCLKYAYQEYSYILHSFCSHSHGLDCYFICVIPVSLWRSHFTSFIIRQGLPLSVLMFFFSLYLRKLLKISQPCFRQSTGASTRTRIAIFPFSCACASACVCAATSENEKLPHAQGYTPHMVMFATDWTTLKA